MNKRCILHCGRDTGTEIDLICYPCALCNKLIGELKDETLVGRLDNLTSAELDIITLHLINRKLEVCAYIRHLQDIESKIEEVELR